MRSSHIAAATGLLCDSRLLNVNDVHNHASLEHARKPCLHGKGTSGPCAALNCFHAFTSSHLPANSRIGFEDAEKPSGWAGDGPFGVVPGEVQSTFVNPRGHLSSPCPVFFSRRFHVCLLKNRTVGCKSRGKGAKSQVASFSRIASRDGRCSSGLLAQSKPRAG